MPDTGHKSHGIYTYADYELVEENEQYEYHHSYGYVLWVQVSHRIYRRSIHTMTWEATLQETIPGAIEAYNHEQGYPGYVNPGNLDEADGWMLQSVEYTKNLSVPLSKDVRETWVKHGDWELVEDIEPNSMSIHINPHIEPGNPEM